jgi:hypothetical protein
VLEGPRRTRFGRAVRASAGIHLREPIAPRRGSPWSPAEERAVLEAKPGQLRAVAVSIGRTVNAVVHRREHLLREGRGG